MFAAQECWRVLFGMCHCWQVGMGALGVVAEVTIKCVQRHQLLETTSVMTRAQVRARHHSLLQDNKHVR